MRRFIVAILIVFVFMAGFAFLLESPTGAAAAASESPDVLAMIDVAGVVATEDPGADPGPGAVVTEEVGDHGVVVGPGYLEGYNPLTGLPEGDPSVLFQKPLMVSVSNFPPSARPQSGLSMAAQVWESYIGEGATRFLAIFYGDYASQLQAILSNRLEEGGPGFVIGPIRSGRVIYEDIKTLFPGAQLITAGASAEVGSQLSNRQNVFGDDPDDVNSAGMDGSSLSAFSSVQGNPTDYAMLTFGPALTEGVPAESLRITYNVNTHVGWTYDPASGKYLRSQDQADMTGELYPALEALTGEQLAFENVVVLWARHHMVTPTIIEVELLYVPDRYGLLFRDGQMYEIHWSSRSAKLQITDDQGNPVPLKPGNTFFQVVSYYSSWNPEEMFIRFREPPYNPD